MIKQSKQFLPPDSLKTLYHALIQPHLTYGILAWGNAKQSVLNRTVILQKRAIRMINNVPYNTHTEPLFKKNKILQLKDLYMNEALLFMNSYLSNQLPRSFDHMFKFNHEGPGLIQTRQASQFHMVQCNTKFASELPLFSLPKIWNNWIKTQKYKIKNSRSSLKNILRNSFIATYMERVHCTNIKCKECNKDH